MNDLQHHTFIDGATTGFEEYKASVMEWTLERGEAVTGVPAEIIQEVAHAYAKADRAVICWTLGITEHHNAVDNVLALINLSLLTGHVGTYGSGVNPLRGQNNVQGGGDMGAIPNKLPGFQDIEKDAAAREKFERAWGVPIIPRYGWHLTQMFHAMERGDLRALYVIGENPANSEADATHATPLLEDLDCLIVQDIFMTKTAELADVVFPASASWAEAEGTVTNSERRVQRVRKALDPPGRREGRHLDHRRSSRSDWASDWGDVTRRGGVGRAAHALADACRHVLRAPRGAGRHPMAVPRRVASGDAVPPRSALGVRRPGDAGDEGTVQRGDRRSAGRRAERRVPAPAHDRTAAGLVQHRRADRRLHVAAPSARSDRGVAGGRGDAWGIEEGERVLVTSRRGAVEAPVHIDHGLRPGLTFMTLHFPEQVETNKLTIEANDPKSGTAEFKATADPDREAAARARDRREARRGMTGAPWTSI